MAASGPLTIDQAKKFLRALEIYFEDNQNIKSGEFVIAPEKRATIERKSEVFTASLLEDIQRKEISDITKALQNANLSLNELVAVYTYLLREISRISIKPELIALTMTDALESENPEAMLAKFGEHITTPNMEQPIEVLYHLIYIAKTLYLLGFFAHNSEALATFLQNNLKEYFTKIFHFEDELKLSKLLENSIKGQSFGNTFVEMYSKILTNAKCDKVKLLKKSEELAEGQFYEINEKLASAQQQLTNLRNTKYNKQKKKGKNKEKENSHLKDVSTKVAELSEEVNRKHRDFLILSKCRQAAAESADYFVVPASPIVRPKP